MLPACCLPSACPGNKNQVFTLTKQSDKIASITKILYFREYFIVAKNLAEIGIFGHNKSSPLIFIVTSCKDLPKAAHIVWSKNLFLMKIFIINKVPT